MNIFKQKKMSAYYRLFWQDIQFESIKMKKGEREGEKEEMDFG
jgi:hypothetical protein